MEVIPAFHTGQRVRRRLTQYVNAAPTPPGYHVSASEHAGNRLCGNSKWDWIFTSLSHYNPLLCEGDHMCQVLLRWASGDQVPAALLHYCSAAGPWVRVPSLALWFDRCPVRVARIRAETRNRLLNDSVDYQTSLIVANIDTLPERREIRVNSNVFRRTGSRQQLTAPQPAARSTRQWHYQQSAKR